jgi:hypothetical protein
MAGDRVEVKLLLGLLRRHSRWREETRVMACANSRA